MLNTLSVSPPLAVGQSPVVPLPLLLIGHGSRDPQGQQAFLELAQAYQALTPHRPVIPCFLELTQPTIAQGVEQCLAQGGTRSWPCRCCCLGPATTSSM